MAVTLANRAYMTTATVGTGTVTLGSPPAGYQSFADAGITDGTRVRYVIEDGYSWEIGSGVYSAAGPTLTRTPSESSNGGAAISLTGRAIVYVTPSASDLQDRGLILLEKYSKTTAREFIYDFPADMPYRRFRLNFTQTGANQGYPTFFNLRSNGADVAGAIYETQYAVSTTSTSSTAYTNGRVTDSLVDLAPLYYSNSLDLEIYLPSSPGKFALYGTGVGAFRFGDSSMYASSLWAKCREYEVIPQQIVTGFEFNASAASGLTRIYNYELYAYTGSDHGA